jgi:hypothetical protein
MAFLSAEGRVAGPTARALASSFRGFLVVLTLAAGPSRAGVIDQYISLALQGNLQPAAALFDSAAVLTPAEAELATRFRQRFILRDEEWPVTPNASPLMLDAMAAYRDYWTRSMMGELGPTEAEARLTRAIRGVLATHGHPTDVPDAEVLGQLKERIEAQGAHVLGGMTRPYLDLMLWTGQDSTRYEVELTDGVQPVDVIFLSDFLVKGWSHFATFGRAYTGGWATKEALYCLREDYDLESERFTVSYLKHEGRHFADYPRFPALEQADLEYRGKLTELIYARESLFHILDHFVRTGEPNPNAPHAYANFAVTTDLSRALFGDDQRDAERYRTVDPELIHAKAGALLIDHTARLQAAGADTTHGVIQQPSR